MIEEIHVKNYALIDSLELSFCSGLNALTGETGAGKSILIGSLGLLLGQKGSPEAIREGEDALEVSGVMNVAGNPEVITWLEEKGLDPEDGRVILRRIVKQNGRGNCFIQGVPVTRKDLEELTSGLIDLHGQHEHQSLLGIENHRKVLDRFAACADLDLEVYQKFVKLTSLRKEIEGVNSEERDRLREIDLLNFAIQEINEAKLRIGEEEDLEAERDLLSQGEKLFQNLGQFNEGVSTEGGSALLLMQEAMVALERVAEIDASQGDLHKRWESAYYEMEDVVTGIRDYQDSLDFSPQRLEECEGRLSEIHMLQKKYGETIGAVLSYGEESIKNLHILENWEANRETLLEELQNLEKEIIALAGDLSRKRKDGAATLSSLIQERLSRLGMEKVQFVVDVSLRASGNGRNSCGPHGFDRVEFLISPNAGESLKPLKSIASGGEISRIMLALKSVLADNDSIQSLIFDEVDSGIGGEVALAVGDHLGEIARHKQVLCITHLASIAVRADKQIKVEKGLDGERTLTRIFHVTGDDRRSEIARMLSGDSQGEVSLSHAEELLNRYQAGGY